MIAASAAGKLKTALQVAMVLVVIVVDDLTAWVDALIYVTVAVTVLSGAGYFFRLQRAQQGSPAPESR